MWPPFISITSSTLLHIESMSFLHISFTSQPNLDDTLDHLNICGAVQLADSSLNNGPQVLNRVKIWRIPWPVQQSQLFHTQE